MKAYDCGNLRNISHIQTFDLTSVEQCENYEEWFGEPKDVDVQILNKPTMEKINITYCEAKKSTILGFCQGRSGGGIDYLQYGIDKHIDINVPYLMSNEDCSKLKNEKKFKYIDGTEKSIGDKTQFTIETYPFGDSNTQDGTCSGEEFTIEGVYYPKHVQRDIINVEIKNKVVEYNTNSKTIQFEEDEVPIVDLSYTDSMRTYIWDRPSSRCPEGGNLQLVYEGKGKLYVPRNVNLPEMLIVKDDDKDVSYGLKLLTETNICNNDVHTTQSSDIIVKMKTAAQDEESWYIQNLPPIKHENLNKFSLLQSQLNFDFISYNEQLTGPITEMARRLCRSERQLIQTQVATLQGRILFIKKKNYILGAGGTRKNLVIFTIFNFFYYVVNHANLQR